jgi:hypothetical protein
MKNKQTNIIKVDQKEISSTEIKEKENLEGILNKHKMITKRPVYRLKKFYFFLFLIILITYLLYYSDKQAKQKKEIQIEAIN